MKIIFLRLITGEDIVVNMIEDNNDHLMMIKPFRIVYYSTEDYKMHMTLVPWLVEKLVKGKGFKLLKRDILLSSDASNELHDYYIQTIRKYKEDLCIGEEIDLYDNEDGLDQDEIESVKNILNTIIKK